MRATHDAEAQAQAQAQAQAHAALPDPDAIGEAELVAALGRVPGGALLLCGLGVGTLLLAWLAVYVFLFIARGPVA